MALFIAIQYWKRTVKHYIIYIYIYYPNWDAEATFPPVLIRKTSATAPENNGRKRRTCRTLMLPLLFLMCLCQSCAWAEACVDLPGWPWGCGRPGELANFSCHQDAWKLTFALCCCQLLWVTVSCCPSLSCAVWAWFLFYCRETVFLWRCCDPMTMVQTWK